MTTLERNWEDEPWECPVCEHVHPRFVFWLTPPHNSLFGLPTISEARAIKERRQDELEQTGVCPRCGFTR